MEEKLLPLEVLHKRIEDVVVKVNKRGLSSHVKREMEKVVVRTEESQKAEKLLSFAESKTNERLVRIVNADVPSSILPSSCKARLLDIQIGRRGPDDKVYNRHADIRRMIPRGTTILQWENTEESWSSVVIYGHKKFTGGVGDEDEEQPENNEMWREYFVTDPGKATSVVCMEKLNGEAAHISSRYIDGQFYLIAGSKNVHMIIKDISDIDKYEGSRYDYAKIIARTACEILDSMDQWKRQLVLSFLHHTRCTFVGEILQAQNQHIVNLNHIVERKLGIISMTPTYTGCQVDSLIAMPPHHFLDLCTALGFSTPSYTVVPVAKVKDHIALVRTKREYEGEVFYYIDEKENTIGLVKVKTVWYVILRALREKTDYTFRAAKKKPHWNLLDNIILVKKRFIEIQKWLKFDDKYLQSWEILAKSFLQWLNEEIKTGTVKSDKIRPTFPLIWNVFLRTTNQSDQIKLQFI